MKIIKLIIVLALLSLMVIAITFNTNDIWIIYAYDVVKVVLIIGLCLLLCRKPESKTPSYSHTWVMCGEEAFDVRHIMYISRNPNRTINVHFADGKKINTMITNYEEFQKEILNNEDNRG